MTTTQFEEQVWKILENYKERYGLVAPQIKSYNHFITRGIQEIIAKEPDIVLVTGDEEHRVHFGEVYMPKAHITDFSRKAHYIVPHDARTMNLFYDSPLHVDITETLTKNGEVIESTKHNRVMIARIPVMLRSILCNLTEMSPSERIAKGEDENDPGGYFITRGNERVLVGQLRANYNQVIVSKSKVDKLSYVAKMRSMSDETGHSVLIQAMIDKNHRNVYFSLPCIRGRMIPAGIVFKAMGIVTQQDLIDILALQGSEGERYSRMIVRDSEMVIGPDDALDYIGKFSTNTPVEKRRQYAWQVLESELLPHMGITATMKEKAIILGSMIRKLVHTSTGIRMKDDLDNYAKKRVDDSGILLYELFRNLFKKFSTTILSRLEKKSNAMNIVTVISRIQNFITKDLQKCFLTGNWGVQGNSYIVAGVSQIMTRLSWIASISHRRRFTLPQGKEGKNAEIRAINPLQYGFACPVETPEGKSAGIVLNMSFLASVTQSYDSVLVKETLDKLCTGNSPMNSIEDTDLSLIKDHTLVFLNGELVGLTQDPESLLEILRSYKGNIFDHTVSSCYDPVDEEIRIFSDSGRFVRPVFTTNCDGLALTKEDGTNWDELVKKGLITYIDASEQDWSYLGMYWNDKGVDFYEIHPAMMMGVLGNAIPWPDHTQSPRNVYQSNMGKQAMGVYAHTYNIRTDTNSYTLHHAQKPLVAPRMGRIMGLDEMCSGINAVVAIICHGGENQEDSVIMNQSAIERGLFVASSRRTVCDEEKKLDSSQTEKIMVPPKAVRKYNVNYSLLDSTGVVRVGVMVKTGDIIIGKVKTKLTKLRAGQFSTDGKHYTETHVDVSTAVKKAEEGIVDRVVDVETPSGFRLVKVVIRKIRVPEVGDKFASRSAQKGTIGATYRQEDMPWTASGIVPDIIINSHAIPSRMTINQLMECVLGKACSINGSYGDASPWRNMAIREEKRGNVVDEITKAMEGTGYNKYGWEMMYNGRTGEALEARIFIGPTYYQRLKHLVSDKIHARAQGHVTNLTRQPQEGRSRHGGIRYGEMERDCMIVHGAATFLRERLFKMSDPYAAPICQNCGTLANSLDACAMCGSSIIVLVELPYACKLLVQELIAMSMKVSMIPSR